MAKSTLELIALSITKSKNPAICMVSTKQGMFSVRKTFLDKRGIVVPEAGAYKFEVPTVVIVELNKAGDLIFGYDELGKPVPATEDSSTLDDKGKPVYKKGEFPKFTTDYSPVRSFISFSDWKAQREMDREMQTV